MEQPHRPGNQQVNTSKSTSRRERWEPEEDLALVKLIRTNGLSWSLLSVKVADRNENQIKNRYHHLMKKFKSLQKCTIKLEQLLDKKTEDEIKVEEAPCDKLLQTENEEAPMVEP
jgi:hypothetical protein